MMMGGRGEQLKRGPGRPRKLAVLQNTDMEIHNVADMEICNVAEAQEEGEIGLQQDGDKVVMTNRGRLVKQPWRFLDLPDKPDKPEKRGRKRKRIISSDDQAKSRGRPRKIVVQGESSSTMMGVSPRLSFRMSTIPSVSKPAEGSNPFQDFNAGDVVWIMFELKNMPAWPGEIVDIGQDDAPESLLSVYVPGSLCVMLFGPSLKGDGNRDSVWARPEMLSPFLPDLEKFHSEFMRLQNERSSEFMRLPNERSSTDFHVAIEEATLRENGNDGCLPIAATTTARNNSANDEMGCRDSILYYYKQFCDICRRVCSGGETNRGRWLHCPKCNVWCHAECDSESSKYPEAEYMCTKCQIYFEVAQKNKKTVEQGEDWVGVMNDKASTAPFRVTVVCRDMEADYLPNYHLVLCECKKCERGNLMSIGDWERHIGCKMRKWKTSVKVKGPNICLEQWLSELQKAGVSGLAYINPDLKEAPVSIREGDLIVSLLGDYQPCKANWSIGTCAVCLLNQDDEQDKIIICSICQVAIHQECYGARNVEDTALASWVCRACETPDIKRECCLCPVVGGALKPTTTHPFWVHVTCAWLVKEVIFPDEHAMEPADGILRVDRNSFKKICVICNQIHGSCIQCYRCPVSFHAMCALLAGYWMQLSIYAKEKNGRDVGKWISYCDQHKPLNSHHRPGLIFGTQKQELSTNQNLNENQATASISTQTAAQGEEETQGEEQLTTASRCRAWPWTYEKQTEPIFHRPKGFCHHSPQVMETINSFNQQAEFSSFKELLRHALENEEKRVCLGKSGIHGYGLFARTSILQGEMVIEYRGEKIGKTVTDAREKIYREQGINCYFFKINDDNIIDATKKGNMGRLINHSCKPNLFAKIIDGEERIELIASRDIAAGEELYFDYRFQSVADQEADQVPCNCGAPVCRKYI